MKRLFIGVLLALPLTIWAQSEVYFTMRPSLSPDAQSIYFEYDTDIWSVGIEGGVASRITAMAGYETYPIVSPDGEWLAFASKQDGDNDVYMVSTAGGTIKQLTFSDADEVPKSWSADSKSINFESNQYNNISAYKISIDGGTPERLFPNYFNTIANIYEMANGSYLFNESTESHRYATRKGYVGDHNPNIKMWNPSSNEYSELTKYNGKDIWPTSDKDNTIYFATHRQGGEANLATKMDDKTIVLTSFDESIQYPRVSYNGEKVAFNKDYQIYVFDTTSQKSKKVDIALSIKNSHELEFSTDVSANISNIAASPDGKKMAFISRGRLFVSDIKGEVVKELQTDNRERAMELQWGEDSKTIFFTRTRNGWYNLFKIDASSTQNEQAIYTPDEFVKNLSISNSNQTLAFTVGSRTIATYSGGEVTSISDEMEFWTFRSGTYFIRFSADDKFLTFNAVNMFESDVYIYEFESKKLMNITNSASYESYPVLSDDYKYLYLAANRYQATFPKGLDKRDTYLFKIPLDKYDSSYDLDKYDTLFNNNDADKEAKSESKSEPIFAFNDENLRRRWSKMKGSSVADVYSVTIGDKQYLLYTSSHENENKPYILDLSQEDSKPKPIKDLKDIWNITSNGKEIFASYRNEIYKIDTKSAAATKIAIKHEFSKSNSDEFSQMVYEAWAQMESGFYDPDMHGVDWSEKLNYYSNLSQYVQNRGDLRILLNDMLNELNSSHLGFTTNGDDEKILNQKTSYYTGVMFKNDQPYVVDYIIGDSPADKVSIDIIQGDELIAVNGVEVDKNRNRDTYFTSAAPMEEVKLTLLRDGNKFDVNIHTFSGAAMKSLLYYEWEDNCRMRVDEKSDSSVAYIHLRDMTGVSLDRFMVDMMSYAVNKEALIIDLRYNTGGNIHNDVIEFLTQQTYFTWKFRDHKPATHPNYNPADRPIVVLVNERSLSDAEVVSNGIKTLNIAKIIGTETYRWIIFTSSVGLINGSSVRMPAWGCYTLSGEDLEKSGVKPDIYVRNTFEDRVNGNDPQLDRAIEEILKDLQK
ncbi:MAG: S41 family peptidase [Rikenellaceae bacterium]